MLLYKIWGFVRQTAIKACLDCEEIIYAVSGGKAPKCLFTKRAKAIPQKTKVKIINETPYSTDIAKCDENGNITNEEFIIASTSDFHLEDDYDLNGKTVEMLARQIADTKADLVVLTGDIIQTKFQQIDAIKFARMMERLGVYWTAVFGNHEVREEKGFYKWLLTKDFADFDHCLCKHGPEELYGYGNYTVNILGEGGKLRYTLFHFDSGRNIRDEYRKEYNIPDDMKGYDFLKKEQIDFYKKETDALTDKYGECKSLMFMHIPLPEYKNIFTGDEETGFTPNPEYKLLYGEQYEGVASSDYNSGMFDAILEKGTTKAVYAGHDHINGWCGEYKGVYLVYNQHGGYSPYHIGTKYNKPESEWMQGVTLTTIYPDGSIDIKPSYNSKYLGGGSIHE